MAPVATLNCAPKPTGFELCDHPPSLIWVDPARPCSKCNLALFPEVQLKFGASSFNL